MRMNEGTADRVIRVIVGLVAAVLAIAVGLSTVGGIILGIVAVILLVTGAIGFCPLYTLFHFSTRNNSGHHHHAAAS
ncbi:MAG: DUF2892 domain-containing protein [Actinomycetota bacterium]|nr:DUF2892 domain-containing protein [Actinomycetota bacterium]